MRILRHRLTGVGTLGDLVDVVRNAGGLPQQLRPFLFRPRLHLHTEDHIADKRLDFQSGQFRLHQQMISLCVRQPDGDFSFSEFHLLFLQFGVLWRSLTSCAVR